MLGHDTNECRHLKDLIEKLIKQNKLQQFVQKNPNQADAAAPPPTDNPRNAPGTSKEGGVQTERRLLIGTISGGPHSAQKSWGEMERYASSLKHAPREECMDVDEE